MSPVVPNLPVVSTCGPWAVPSDVTEVDVSGFTIAQTKILTDCLQAASDVLFHLSGRQFSGSCMDTVRPLPRILNRDHGRPIASNAGGFGYYSGGYMGGYGYSRFGWVTTNAEELPAGYTIPSVDLGVFPLTAIVEVIENGVVVDPATYEIQDSRHLVRLASPASAPGYRNDGWIAVQRMDLPITAPGTWQVTFVYGVPAPIGGIMAAAELGWQLYLASTPTADGQIRLPQRVVNIARQGLSAAVADPLVFLEQGRTGLIRADAWLESVNSGKLTRRATAMNVDLDRRTRRTTWTSS